MHDSSYSKMASFFRTYSDKFPGSAEKSVVLEIGSKSYEGQGTYRSLIDDDKQTYVGLDLEAGLNVDVVPEGAYVWPEIADDSIHVCISGQTFEHNPFFWATICEIARVLAPGGYLCLIAPGGGGVHRYPMDCWRFYPDCWSALCALAGLELIESYFEGNKLASEVAGGHWRDSMMIARKPGSPPDEATERRRASMTAPFRDGFGAFEPEVDKSGPCVEDYLATVNRKPVNSLRRKLANRIFRSHVVPIYEPKNG